MRCSVSFIASAKWCRKFIVNPPALFWSAQLGKNAKFLDTLQSKKKATRFQVAIFHSKNRGLREKKEGGRAVAN